MSKKSRLIITRFLGVLFLLGSVAAGIALIQQRQGLSSEATTAKCSSTVRSTDESSEACYGKRVGNFCSRTGITNGYCKDTGFKEGGVGTIPGTGPVVCACEKDNAPQTNKTTPPQQTPASNSSSGQCTSGYCHSHSLAPDGFINNCGEVGKSEGTGSCNNGRCCQNVSDSPQLKPCGNLRITPLSGTAILPGENKAFRVVATSFDSPLTEFRASSSNNSVAKPGRNNYSSRVIEGWYKFQAYSGSSSNPIIKVPLTASPGSTARITFTAQTKEVGSCSSSITIKVAEPTTTPSPSPSS